MRFSLKNAFTIGGLATLGVVIAFASFTAQIQSSLLSESEGGSAISDIGSSLTGGATVQGGSGGIISLTSEVPQTIDVSLASVEVQPEVVPALGANLTATGSGFVEVTAPVPAVATGIVLPAAAPEPVVMEEKKEAQNAVIAVPTAVDNSFAQMLKSSSAEPVTPVVETMQPVVDDSRDLYTFENPTLPREVYTEPTVASTPKTGGEWFFLLVLSSVLAFGLRVLQKRA